MKMKKDLRSLAAFAMLAATHLWGTLPEVYPWCTGQNCGDREPYPLYLLEDLPVTCSTYGEIGLEFLYLKPYSDGLDIALKANIVNPGSSFAEITSARPEHADFRWAPGFRITTGISNEALDLYASYSYLRSKGDTTMTSSLTGSGSGDLAVNIWSTNTITSNLVNIMRTHYKALYDVADVDIGKSLYIDPNFFFCPRMGLRVARVEQRLHLDCIENVSAQTVGFLYDTVRLSNRFVGVGLKTGADTTYSIYKWFSFYANGSFSLLAGSFDIDQKENFPLTSGTEVVPINSQGNFTLHALRPSVDIHIGVNFGTNFGCNGTNRFEGSIGYEFEYWPNQLQLNRYQIQRNGYLLGFTQNGDFMLHGLEINAAFYF